METPKQCQSLYNVEVGHYTQEEEEEEYTEVAYNSEVLPRRSGSGVIPPSAAMAQTTSAVATAILTSRKRM